MISGNLLTEKGQLNKDDFFVIDEAGNYSFEINEASTLFLISALKEPGYLTYAASRS